MTEYLKPCPFCGGPVTLQKRGDRLVVILCEAASPCRGSGLGQYLDADRHETAVAAWNRRAPSVTT